MGGASRLARNHAITQSLYETKKEHTGNLKLSLVIPGHRLINLFGVTGPPLLVLGAVFQPAWIAQLKDLFPDLEIISNQDESRAGEVFLKEISDDQWRGATIIVTGKILPEPALLPKLCYIQLQTAGANHMLNHRSVTNTKAALCTASGIHGPSIAEWVLATFLASRHRIIQYAEFQKNATWNKLGVPVQDSVGQRVGILGYGAVGRQVARVFKAIGMHVYACTLRARETPDSRRYDGYTPPGCGDPEGSLPSRWFAASTEEQLHGFLRSGLDVLVITVPLTPKTRSIIGRKEFSLLAEKKTFVSNVSRGEVMDTDSLIEALEGDLISGAALDVTDPEPLPDGHRLWHTKNVIITPHVSGDSGFYARGVFEVLKDNLIKLSKGQELSNTVNLKEGY